MKAESPAWQLRLWRLLPFSASAASIISRNPDLLRFYAKRMGAKTTEIKGASHVPFLSHPKAVVKVIEAAAPLT